MYGRTRGNWLSQIRATKKYNENRKIEPWRMWLVECQLNVIMPTSKVKTTSQRKVVEVHVPVPVWSMYWKFIHLDARVPKMLPGDKNNSVRTRAQLEFRMKLAPFLGTTDQVPCGRRSRVGINNAFQLVLDANCLVDVPNVTFISVKTVLNHFAWKTCQTSINNKMRNVCNDVEKCLHFVFRFGNEERFCN